MKKSFFNNDGFSLIELIIILSGIAILIGAGAFIYKRDHRPKTTTPISSSLGSGFRTTSNTISYQGKTYTPYGVTIYGLAESTYQINVSSDINQIDAIANYWHGNTVRIQIAPDIYNTQNSNFNADLNKEVTTARADGLNVILSAQYERTKKIAGPDNSTTEFWKSLATVYANDSHVWLDLFNEPRYTCPANSIPTLGCWNIWKNGDTSYVGMQSLVNEVRSAAPNNLIIAEGLAGGKSLEGINNYLLSGSNIVYSIHPYFGSLNSTPGQWDSNFGNISFQVPVLAGEWGEYETTRGSCVANAPALVPEFMSYLKSHKIGLIAWTLQPGNMIRGNNLENPTSFDSGVSYQCVDHVNDTNAQGSGVDIRNLFISAQS